MYNTILSTKEVACLVLLIITGGTGYALFKSGVPYGTLLFAIHKLATVAMVILGTGTFVRLFRSSASTLPGLALSSAICAIAIIGLLVSGGAMSLNRLTSAMRVVHSSAAALLVTGIAILIFQLNQ